MLFLVPVLFPLSVAVPALCYAPVPFLLFEIVPVLYYVLPPLVPLPPIPLPVYPRFRPCQSFVLMSFSLTQSLCLFTAATVLCIPPLLLIPGRPRVLFPVTPCLVFRLFLPFHAPSIFGWVMALRVSPPAPGCYSPSAFMVADTNSGFMSSRLSSTLSFSVCRGCHVTDLIFLGPVPLFPLTLMVLCLTCSLWLL